LSSLPKLKEQTRRCERLVVSFVIFLTRGVVVVGWSNSHENSVSQFWRAIFQKRTQKNDLYIKDSRDLLQSSSSSHPTVKSTSLPTRTGELTLPPLFEAFGKRHDIAEVFDTLQNGWMRPKEERLVVFAVVICECPW
jgi:hypothetical protein